MALVSATLASSLATLEPTDSVSVAIDRIATAFTNYFGGASVLGALAAPAVLDGAPKSAMAGAMGGLNSIGGAAGAISAGISAFWSALLGLEATIWIMIPPTIMIPSTTILPPGLGGLTAAIQGAFDANVAAGSDLASAANTLAAAIHGTQLGGTVQTQVPPSAPVASPIL